MSDKPFEIRKSGRHFHLYFDFDTALAHGARPSRERRQKFESLIGAGAVPLSEDDGKANFVLGGKPLNITKAQARDYAHKVGRYMLGFSDLVFTYCDGLK